MRYLRSAHLKMRYSKTIRVLALSMLFSAFACGCTDEVHHYKIKYEVDVDIDDSSDFQEEMYTNSHSECNKASNVDVKDDVKSYFFVIVYYHSSFGYDLVGSHQLYTNPPEDPFYRHGFYAKYYCPDNKDCSDTYYDEDALFAESGTVTVTEKNGKLEMDYDIVFSDEVRETGHWKLKQCGDPVITNP